MLISPSVVQTKVSEEISRSYSLHQLRRRSVKFQGIDASNVQKRESSLQPKNFSATMSWRNEIWSTFLRSFDSLSLVFTRSRRVILYCAWWTSYRADFFVLRRNKTSLLTSFKRRWINEFSKRKHLDGFLVGCQPSDWKIEKLKVISTISFPTVIFINERDSQ